MLRVSLVTALALGVALSPSFAGYADTAGCSLATSQTTGCTTAVKTDKDVTLKIDVRKPGGGSGDPRFDSDGGAATPQDPSTLPYLGRPGYTVTMPVTLSDLARFRPNPGRDLMQPDGWMIVGLSTNFYAHAAQHIKTGTLLGEPASVRFTPVRYAWSYGDGATRTTSTPGATWAALGINEFDATPTSHIYRAPGRYFIDLSIGYAPEYRFASSPDWVALDGLIWVPANRLVAVASAGAKTVLVQDECTTNPAGPGC